MGGLIARSSPRFPLPRGSHVTAGLCLSCGAGAWGRGGAHLADGREIWLDKGNLTDAIRASIAMPGIISPYPIEGRWLSDGGLVNQIPVSTCRALGADFIIAVDVGGGLLEKHAADLRQPSRASVGHRWPNTCPMSPTRSAHRPSAFCRRCCPPDRQARNICRCR